MRALLFFAFIGFPFLMMGQVKISGIMTDNKKNPLRAASISIVNSYDGTVTDSLGKFSFTTSEKGTQVLEAGLGGYAPFRAEINIGTEAIVQNISVKELITELNAVTITAGSFEASDKKKGTVLTSLDVVTTAGSNGDITGALKTLPGTQQVGESEGLFVRGGSATESKIFIDGTLVNNFFYSSLPGIATRGRFNPFLFKGTVFSTGGYSALYGQALSAALILESNDLPERSEGSVNISVIGGGAAFQKLSKNKKAGGGLSYGYTNLAFAFAVIKQRPDFYKTPVYHTFDANYRFKTRNGGIFKYYGYGSYNKLALRSPDIDSLALNDAFEISNFNTFQNISLRENIGKGWKLNAAASFSNNRDNILNELQDAAYRKQEFTAPAGYAFKNFSLLGKSYFGQGRIVFDKKLSGINTLRFGTDYFHSTEQSFYTLYTGERFKEAITDNINAVFAETDLYLTTQIALKTGARFEYSSLMKRANIGPRISVAYKLKDKSQVSFAYGIFYQNPERRSLPALNSKLDFSKASHYILQYQKQSNDRIFRTEIFYKDYDDLFKTSSNGFGRQVAANNSGYGYAKGAEIFIRDKKSIKDLDYWVSYSFLDTKRDYQNFPGLITPSFAAKHTASLVAKKFVLPWKTGFNASYNYASGRPFYNFAYNAVENKFDIKEEGETISYNSLSFSLNYLPKLGRKDAKSFIVYVLSLTNVLGNKQVYGYNFSALNNNKAEVVPPSKRFLYIGCFISFGTDRTQEAINNNL